MGGLGAHSLDKFARALRLRWLWLSWHAPNRPWIGSEIPCDEQDKNLFATATTVTIGDGEIASFWESTWIGATPFRMLAPSLFLKTRQKKKSVKEAITNDSWINDINRPPLTAENIAEFLLLWNLLRSQNIVLNQHAQDQITWKTTQSGCYTTAAAYRLQFAGRTASTCPHILWKAWAPPRCKFFGWLTLHDRIWTADRLQRRGWPPNEYFCPLCVRNLETSTHLFWQCPVSTAIWKKISRWKGCVTLNPTSWNTNSTVLFFFF